LKVKLAKSTVRDSTGQLVIPIDSASRPPAKGPADDEHERSDRPHGEIGPGATPVIPVGSPLITSLADVVMSRWGSELPPEMASERVLARHVLGVPGTGRWRHSRSTVLRP
jgi:hypothetical protein